MEKQRQIAKTYLKMKLHEQKSDFAFWQTQSYATRLAALEEIRREHHGWTAETEPRLQRVVKIIRKVSERKI